MHVTAYNQNISSLSSTSHTYYDNYCSIPFTETLGVEVMMAAGEP